MVNVYIFKQIKLINFTKQYGVRLNDIKQEQTWKPWLNFNNKHKPIYSIPS
jgi:hypothetical protein